ncbi:MAG: PHP domain-containing protein [Deltaproteobacteria bacterium]|nr:PHP domain-containing protein [Deltaproteobacteria bacterium]
MIDLHAHTTASDGRLTPTQLVSRARGVGVTVLAITDHDTVAGVAEAIAAARALGGIEIVPGIEISTSIGAADIHVLGHFLRVDDPALVAFTAEQEGERRARMERMVANMNALGVPVTMARVEAIAGSDNLCRPHLARALVELGACRDLQDAFARYIGDDAPAFSAHRRPDAAEAIRLIHSAGGAATLAHPEADGIDRARIVALEQLGLDGLEVVRNDQPSPIRERYLQLALELQLVPTGGSDFHDEGGALGGITMSRRDLEALAARSAGR